MKRGMKTKLEDKAVYNKITNEERAENKTGGQASVQQDNTGPLNPSTLRDHRGTVSWIYNPPVDPDSKIAWVKL